MRMGITVCRLKKGPVKNPDILNFKIYFSKCNQEENFRGARAQRPFCRGRIKTVGQNKF